MFSRSEAHRLLKRLAEEMYRAVLERLREGDRPENPKEFGRLMDYTSAGALRRVLEEIDVKPRVVSEEWFEDYVSTEDWLLVVDPIDGTSNLSRGVPFSAVSLAIANGRFMDDVYAGLVKNIFTGDEYFAYLGEGAYKNGSRIRVSKTLKTIDAFISLSIVHQYPGKSRTLDLLRYTNYPRHLGSAALEDCLVAEAVLDAHVDIRGSLRVFDIAASQLIVREAGGKVYLTQDWSREVDLLKIKGIRIVSASTPHLMEKILDILGV